MFNLILKSNVLFNSNQLPIANNPNNKFSYTSIKLLDIIINYIIKCRTSNPL